MFRDRKELHGDVRKQKLPSGFHPCCVTCHAQCQPLLSRPCTIQLQYSCDPFIYSYTFICLLVHAIYHSFSHLHPLFIDQFASSFDCLSLCVLAHSLHQPTPASIHSIHQPLYLSCLQISSEESTDNAYEVFENAESCHVMMQRQGDQSSRAHKRAGGAVCQRALLRCHQRPHSAAGAVSREGSFLQREGRWNVLLLALDPCDCKCLCSCCAGTCPCCAAI